MVIFLARSFSVEVPDMYTQTTIAIVLAAILFVAYLQVSGFYASRDSFKSRNMIPEMPEEAVAPPILVPPPMPVPVMKQRLDEPQNSDPYDDTRGDSDIKDNLRHPERLFGPTSSPDDTDTAVSSGVASPLTNNTLQSFSPEYAQNGGEFIPGGIFANDTFETPNYSAI
jgi:hypothetical protein